MYLLITLTYFLSSFKRTIDLCYVNITEKGSCVAFGSPRPTRLFLAIVA